MMPADTDQALMLRQAFEEQYHAGLAMLAECVEKCPDDLWTLGTHPRTFWRIAFHAVYFTHLYLGQGENSYRPWPGRPDDFPGLWQNPWSVEPFELPEDYPPYTPGQVLDYLAYVDTLIGPTVSSLDLDASETGFSWYPGMSKLSHQLMNLRHLQGHVGQLSELVMAHGIDMHWIGKRVGPTVRGGTPAPG